MGGQAGVWRLGIAVVLGSALLGRGLRPAGKGLCSCAEGQALGLVNP